MARNRPLPSGASLAPGYTVVTHICRNEATDIYDVWSHERICRCVAKAVRGDRRTEPRPRSRLIAEGQLLQRLSHPHLVRAYETIVDPDPIVILEPLTGATLDDVIEATGRPLAVKDLVYLGLQLASAVHYLHRHGVLHLDLKPENVINQGGLAKLLDLSLAQAPGPVRGGRGTREYLAPEQARGGQATAATDVWGLGMTLYEAATARLPFDASDGSRGTYPQLGGPATPLRRHRRLPRSLGGLIDACLRPEPDGRPTMADVISALNEHAAYPSRPPDPPSRRRMHAAQ